MTTHSQTKELMCNTSASTKQLAEVFAQLRNQGINIRKIELTETLGTAPEFFLRLEMNYPESVSDVDAVVDALKAELASCKV